jgi:zinc finger protein
MSDSERDMLIVDNQQCPVCAKESATFTEFEIEDAFAGPIAIFTIRCNDCGYRTSDLEFLEPGQPAEYSVDIESKEDLKIRIIKSGECEIKIPNFRISVDSTMNSEGFITNVEGVIRKFEKTVISLKDGEEDKAKRKTLKNLLKGIQQVLDGEKKITMKMIDKSGNSAMISDKVVVKKLKAKKK